MKYKVEIPFRLPSLNDYINICRRNKFEASNFKKGVEGDIIWAIRKSKVPKIELPVKIKITWIEKNKKRDLDNIVSAKKYIFDALVKEKIIKNDSQKYVVELLPDEIIIDRNVKDGKVIVEIEKIIKPIYNFKAKN